MRRINPAKLDGSKWTAVEPRDREKHFIVTRVITGEGERPVGCILEAIHSRREYHLDWRELADETRWHQGWR